MSNQNKLSNEAKVGGLLVATLLIAVLFAWLLGAKNPFSKTLDFYVVYNFAGGIDVGSPVRVAGIKVGKVDEISFLSESDVKKLNIAFGPNDEYDQSVLSPLKIKISIKEEAAESVRHDSKFFVNLAGIIGERYIEITPGTYAGTKIREMEVVRGIDPPRIDQLISQSFNLAGKIQKILEDNEGNISKNIKMLHELSVNINKTIQQIDQSKVFKTNISQLINNLISITDDVKKLTAKTQSEEGKKTLDLLHKLLWRLEPLDSEAIKKFLQKEGIRARLL